MKFLYFTDTHIRGNAPANRKDNFLDTLRAKFAEVAELAREHDVCALLHGGDFFDLPNPSLTVVGDFLALLQGAGKPVYAIAGNHDLFGHNPDTLPRTVLGFIARLGLINLLNPGENVFLTDEHCTVQITGQHYHYDMDRRDPNLDYVIQKSAQAHVAIHLVHGMLMDKAFMEGVAHTTIDQIRHTEADVTICGHNHLGFADYQLDNKWFVNPGALIRLSNHPHEMTRRPQVLLVECSATGVSLKRIVLKSGAPGTEVLDRSASELAAYQEERLSSFVQSIRSAGDYKGIDIASVIETIANREGIQPDVKTEALRRIGLVQEKLTEQGGGSNG